MTAAEGSAAGRHFVAITDPGTALQALAESKRYRDVFLNPADIGGRFSALSLFGLVPGGAHRRESRRAPRGRRGDGRRVPAGEPHQSPGSRSGAFIGAAALEGRDKLTLALPPSLASLGLWIEQLVAESTGKHGKGALPVVDEPLGRPDEYGNDRAFVAIATDRDAPDEARLAALEAAGHPVLRLSTRIDGLGAEFFRWEFATAVAGAALGINPFDEPNVAEAKEKTKVLLGTFASDGRLPETAAAASSAGISAFSPTFTGSSPAAVVRAALASLGPSDYVAFLSYLPAHERRRSRNRRDSAGHPRETSRRQHLRRRPALPPLDRAVPQGRAEHRARVRHHERRRDDDGDSRGGVFLRDAEAGAGARRRRNARRARPPRRARCISRRRRRSATLEAVFAEALR